MATFNVHEAKSNLSRLLELAEEGEEVLIARHGTPVARLVPIPQGVRKLGTMAGLVKMEEGWDAPLTDVEAEQQFGL